MSLYLCFSFDPDSIGLIDRYLYPYYKHDIENGIITVIEGNKSNGVGKRTIPVNGQYIRGYGVPKYDMSTSSGKAVLKGIDLSKAQGFVNFKAVKEDGISFAILRSTMRNGNVDPRFEEYVKGCEENDIPWSVYKLSYAMTPAQSFLEASNVVKTLNGRMSTIWLDLESSEQITRVKKAGLTSIINAFMDYCIASGYDTGIYCNLTWYRNYVDDSFKKRFKFWIAHYPKNDYGVLVESARPNVGEVIWQYTSKGRISGIDCFVDLDVRQ